MAHLCKDALVKLLKANKPIGQEKLLEKARNKEKAY
jgi:hypothetical protein